MERLQSTKPRREKMYCIKILEQRLTAQNSNRQLTEFSVRAGVLNRVTALGTPITYAIG